jgi:hypothetical protein
MLWLSFAQHSPKPIRQKRLDRLVQQVTAQAATKEALENLLPRHAQREFVATAAHVSSAYDWAIADGAGAVVFSHD